MGEPFDGHRCYEHSRSKTGQQLASDIEAATNPAGISRKCSQRPHAGRDFDQYGYMVWTPAKRRVFNAGVEPSSSIPSLAIDQETPPGPLAAHLLASHRCVMGGTTLPFCARAADDGSGVIIADQVPSSHRSRRTVPTPSSVR